MKTLSLSTITLLFTLLVVAQERQIPIDTTVVTNHTITVKGKPVAYTATTGTQPVWDDQGMPIATLFYTYYKRTNGGKTSNRPLIMSFNGGPGSASVWMHVAILVPRF